MNVTREQIERLMDHAGVSYEDAQAALEASDGDLLDALVWLERMGKIPSSGVHSCATDPRVEPETPDMEAEEVLDQEEPDDVLHTVWRWLVDNRLEVYRRDNRARVLECPLAALLALAALFAPLFLKSLAYTVTFAAAGIVAGATGQKQCARLCHLYFEGARLCGSVLVLYFFMVFLSTALLLLAGNGGFG